MTATAVTETAAPSLSLLDRAQPLLLVGSIGLGLGLGALVPRFADQLLALVSVGVFALIYLVMIGLDLRHMGRSLSSRRFLATAAIINFVVNPLVAWGLAAVFLRSHPDLWVGLILFLVTPCIGWYLIFTELADGDAGLGVMLLGINVVLQILLLPFYVYVFAGQRAGVDVGSIIESVGLFLVLPLTLATITRWFIDRSSSNLGEVAGRYHLRYLKTLILAIVIMAMFASQADEIFDNPTVVLRLIAPITAFFAIAFVLAVAVGRLMGFPYEQIALLVFTATSRNSEASLAVAVTAFSSPFVALTVVMGPVIELPLLVLMVRALLTLRSRLSAQTTATTPEGSKPHGEHIPASSR